MKLPPTAEAAGAHRPLEFLDATHVCIGRRVLAYFAGGNYLGLGRHPAVLYAMRRALDLGMTQPGASRSTTGEHRLYGGVETALARFFRHPAAALVPSGYLAPLAAVQALRAHCTHLFVEETAHACVQDAAKVAGHPIHLFQHHDLDGLRKALSQLPKASRPLILTDGTRGIRGGLNPLDDLLEALPARGWLLVDDAHGAGAVGPGGRGAVAHFGLKDPRIMQTVSLAKALGVGGGAVLGTRALIEELRGRAPAFVGTTSIPLTIPAGIEAALRVIELEPERIERLQANMRQFHEALLEHGCVEPAETPRAENRTLKQGEISNSPLTPVTSVIPSSAARVAAVRRALSTAGIYPSFIQYPGGPKQGFLRLAISSEHDEAELCRLASALAKGLGNRSRLLAGKR